MPVLAISTLSTCHQLIWEYKNMLVLKLHALDFGWEMTIRVRFYPWLVGSWSDWGQHWWGKVLLFPLVPTFSKLDLRRSTIVRTCVPLFISSSKHFGGALMLELLLLADVIGSLRGRRLRRENLCACIREHSFPAAALWGKSTCRELL